MKCPNCKTKQNKLQLQLNNGHCSQCNLNIGVE